MTTDDTMHVETNGTAGSRSPHPDLDRSNSVNAILARYPSTLPVFNRFGLDTCCGGDLSLSEAARAADVSEDVVYGALIDAIVA